MAFAVNRVCEHVFVRGKDDLFHARCENRLRALKEQREKVDTKALKREQRLDELPAAESP